MTLQSFADIESNNNLADPEVRTTPVSNVSSLCCRDVSTTAHSCVVATFILLNIWRSGT